MYFKSARTSYNNAISAIPSQSIVEIPFQNLTLNLLMSQRSAYTSFYISQHTKLITQNFKAMQTTFNNLETNPSYMGNWNQAIQHAWDYEKFDIQLGGRGSFNATRAEREEILKYGKLKRFKNSDGKWDSAKAHHISNKHNHPDAQSNAHNIKIFRNENEHKLFGHNGDYHNPSDGDWINRDEMVRRTFRKGLIKREIYAAGIAAAIGFVSTASISLIIDLSENDIDPELLKTALKNAGQSGIYGAGNGLLYYGGFRLGSTLLDEVATGYIQSSSKMAKFLKSNGGKMAVIGGLIIIGDSIYTITNDMSNGSSFSNSLKNTVKKEIQPLAILGLSIWSLPAGITASIICLGYDLWISISEKKLLKKIEQYYNQYYFDSVMSKLR